MQKAQLFGGTIRSNLLWGSKNASDADLWAALETAQAAEFVKAKPLGLDEPVEQGGRNLSGGQKQRLTIARALVGKPDILILDDSASALDYATDAALRKALAALPGGLTVFIVSQRAASSSTPTRSSCWTTASSWASASTPSCWQAARSTKRSTPASSRKGMRRNECKSEKQTDPRTA